jgi:Arc/MetJ-type ribon-helix-helix transcriptional regulator
MPKMQVYLPDDLYAQVKAQVKAQGQDFNVSGILQQALQERIDHENRLAAGREAVADYETEFGAFPDADLTEQASLDLENSIHPQRKKKRPHAA